MKIEVPERQFTGNGLIKSRKFFIAANTHIMRTLADLYQEPLWAVVREIGSNMLDAYAALKRRDPDAEIIPPEIHVPSEWEPYLVFKDYGVGMSDETIETVFLGFGASTKGDNNDELGAFGLGAKVPFAYRGSEQWTIESRFGGEKRLYVATIDADQEPSLHTVTEEETVEHDGITVTIPVNADDIQAAADHVARFLRYFPMDVTLTGREMAIAKPTYHLSGDGWGVTKQKGAWQAVMGAVAYPIDTYSIYNQVPYEITKAFGGDLIFGIGELDVTPSRDALKYSEKTITALKAHFQKFQQDVVGAVKDKVDASATLWEALQNAEEAYRVGLFRGQIAKCQWEGKPLPVQHGIEVKRQDLLGQVPDLTFQVARIKSKYHSAGQFRAEAHNDVYLTPRQKTFIYINDTNRGAASRINEYRYHNQNVTWESEFLIIKGTGVTKEMVSEWFGGAPVHGFISELPIPERTTTRTQRRKDPTVLRFVPESSRAIEVLPPDEGGYYVKLRGSEATEANHIGNYGLCALVEAVRSVGLLGPDQAIYGVPRSAARLEKDENWIPFIPYITEVIKKNKKLFRPSAMKQAEWKKFCENNQLVEYLMEGLPYLSDDKLPRSGKFSKLVTALRQVQKVDASWDEDHPYARSAIEYNLGIKLPKAATKADRTRAEKLYSRLVALLGDVEKRYPMLALLAEKGDGPLPSEAEKILNYIKLVDRRSK